MAKTHNQTAAAAPVAAPVEVPRVTYTTIEGITTVIAAPATAAAPTPPTQEIE